MDYTPGSEGGSPTLSYTPMSASPEPGDDTLFRRRDLNRLVDSDARRQHISMYAFENEIGGRVIVSCLDLATASGQSFNHPFRVEQLQAAVRWLARDAVPILLRFPFIGRSLLVFRPPEIRKV